MTKETDEEEAASEGRVVTPKPRGVRVQGGGCGGLREAAERVTKARPFWKAHPTSSGTVTAPLLCALPHSSNLDPLIHSLHRITVLVNMSASLSGLKVILVHFISSRGSPMSGLV